jgi:hypothetical protein
MTVSNNQKIVWPLLHSCRACYMGSVTLSHWNVTKNFVLIITSARASNTTQLSFLFTTHIAANDVTQHSLSSHVPPKQTFYCTNNISVNKRRQLDFHDMTTDNKRFPIAPENNGLHSTYILFQHWYPMPVNWILQRQYSPVCIVLLQTICIHLVSALCMPSFNNI